MPRPLYVEITVVRTIGLFSILPFLLTPLAARAEGLSPLLLEFGQPRTLLWSILEEKPQGAVNLAFHLADQLALNPDRKKWPYLSGTSLTFTPLLKYDRNVNNGFKGDTVYIWGLPFAVDEDTKAVEAATVGGAVAGGLSFGIARGITFTMSGRAEYQRAIGKEFEVFNTTAAMNVGYTAQSWAYLDAGFVVNEEKRAFTNDNIKVASFTAGKLLGKTGSQLHDISGTFTRVEEKSTWQNRARVDWTGYFADNGVFKLGLERGEEIDGSLLPKISVTASYSNEIFGAATTVSAYYSEKTGGYFFGAAREDNIYKIRADRKITDRISIFASYERKNSTIDSFDDSGVDVGFNITSFKF